MLTEIEGSCASVASSNNSGNAMSVQMLQRTTSSVLENTRLLRAINQTWTRSAEQLRQQHNRTFSNITTELSAIQDMLSMFIINCLCQGRYAFCVTLYVCLLAG